LNNTLEFIAKRYGISFDQEMPIKLQSDRMKEMPKLFRKLGFKVGAEIGVCKGRYSKCLCQWIPGLKLYCVDTWKIYDDYVEGRTEADQKNLDDFLEITKGRLAPYNYEIIRATSLEAAKQIKDGSLDFVFIDANHSFEFAIDDIAAWSKKVRPGGIISGHDFWNSIDVPERKIHLKGLPPYEKMRLCQVKDAVDAWTKSNQISPWFVTALDDCSSWFWVRE
jgi:hypothetical protein